MTTLQMLTLRRTTSLGRMAAIEKRAERLGAPAAPVVKSALEELSTALEEVQVATDQLESHLDELGAVRAELEQLRAEWDEFMDVIPIACVWTSTSGEIVRSNGAAAALLNVSAQRLAGRPLVLFLAERNPFHDALSALDEGLTRTVELQSVVRPRERRPRPVRIVGRSLRGNRRCWFISVTEGQD